MKTALFAAALLFAGLSRSQAQQTESLPPSLSSQDSVQQSQDSGQSLGDLARHARKDHSEETQMSAEDAKKQGSTQLSAPN